MSKLIQHVKYGDVIAPRHSDKWRICHSTGLQADTYVYEADSYAAAQECLQDLQKDDSDHHIVYLKPPSDACGFGDHAFYCSNCGEAV